MKTKLFTLVGISLIIVGCKSEQNDIHPTNFVTFPPTPTITEHANEIFLTSIAEGVEVNQGITIERALLLKPTNTSPPSPNFLSFTVYNHTEEPIKFSNIGFSAKLFHFSPSKNKWEEIKLSMTPADDEKIIPKNLETVDSKIPNTWDIPNWELEVLPYEELRVYIEGLGIHSKKKYGAYLDFTIQK